MRKQKELVMKVTDEMAITAPEVEQETFSITCDLCGAEITDYKNDLFHHTGIINGKFDDHIHLCKKCEEEVKPPLFNFDTRTVMERQTPLKEANDAR
jgi:hypothetical protein